MTTMKRFTSRATRLWLWVRKYPKKMTIPVTVVVLMAVFLGGRQFIHFYNYMEEDPRFCNSCHLMEESWDRWAISEHKNIACHSCHQQSALAGAMQLVDFALGRYERVERHAAVQDDVCEECHESNSPRWIQVAATAGHRQHAEKEHIACTKCHSTTVHRFRAPEPICGVCHEGKHMEIDAMVQMHCPTCHQFLVDKEKLLPSRKDCLNCHEALTENGVSWPADAPMQYPCGDCHQPHQQAEPMIGCLSCHTVGEMHLQGEHSASPCQTCHHPHEWQVTKRETCLTCHPGRAQHQPGTLCSDCHGFPGQQKVTSDRNKDQTKGQ